MLSDLAVGQAPGGHLGDAEFLGGKGGKALSVIGPGFARGPQLAAGFRGQEPGAQAVKGVQGEAERCAGLGVAALPAEPFAVGEVQTGAVGRATGAGRRPARRAAAAQAS